MREKGLVDSAMDDLDFEQDFGKEKSSVGPKTTGEGSTSSKKKSKKGFLYYTGMIFSVSKNLCGQSQWSRIFPETPFCIYVSTGHFTNFLKSPFGERKQIRSRIYFLKKLF